MSLVPFVFSGHTCKWSALHSLSFLQAPLPYSWARSSVASFSSPHARLFSAWVRGLLPPNADLTYPPLSYCCPIWMTSTDLSSNLDPKHKNLVAQVLLKTPKVWRRVEWGCPLEGHQSPPGITALCPCLQHSHSLGFFLIPKDTEVWLELGLLPLARKACTLEASPNISRSAGQRICHLHGGTTVAARSWLWRKANLGHRTSCGQVTNQYYLLCVKIVAWQPEV